MPKPSLRTRAKKRVHVRLPGSRSTIHYKKKKIKGSHCPRCGQPFFGIPCLSPSKQRKLPLTQQKTGRPYSGQLCHNCLRELIKQTVRASTT